MNRLFSFDLPLLSIFLVTAVEIRIPVTFEIALSKIRFFKKEIKNLDFRITVRPTAIY
jgi:hypothetical protein